MRRNILILLSLSFSICQAQEKKPSFEKVIEHYLFKSTSDRLFDAQKNQAYIYSMGISFNDKGLIDTLYFSDKIDSVVRDIFMLDDRKVKLFKSITIPFKEYANRIVVLTLYHYNSEDGMLDYGFGLLRQVEKLYPIINSSKPIVLHQPIVFGFIRHIN
ncbi:hypothetical protein [Pedobacter sp. KBS0701]|uniref:hypothetical protein n=1 Tax=unclassified Pedobacter TaxID=2628915 RepID=UPI00110D5A0D|nr:hypothetical protein [Pedobacter sp. KBS0701]QDW23737.1 hypothetical protein FFJ24_002415 [Pedobacter sp. KBS0701]